MKKIVSILLIILFVTGCSNRIDLNNYDAIINTFLTKESRLVNTYSSGYKYYLPNGVKVVDSKDFNDKLTYNGYDYYLYVDVISYYYNVDISYTENNNLFYSKKLDYNGIKGYIEVTELDNIYKVVMYYNYSKIEGYVREEDLSNTIMNMCSILNSIKINKSIIESYIGNEEISNNEEIFDFYKPTKEGNFINYINQFDAYKEEVKEDNIGNEGN